MSAGVRPSEESTVEVIFTAVVVRFCWGEMLWNTTFPQFYMYVHMLKDKERLKKNQQS